MDKEDAVSLASELDGDEHDWVDFKEDYYVLGLANKEADFIRDIAAMANTFSGESTHIIIVGVDDDSGNLTGISEDYDDGEAPHHIASVDEADLQSKITEYISPTPTVRLHKYISHDPKIVVLEVFPFRNKPCMIDKNISFHGNIELKKGLIYTRHGSRNSLVLREGLEEIIEERIENRRDKILSGITKAVEVGPEKVAEIGEVIHSEDGEGDITVRIGEDADFVLDERISRDPVSELDSRLDQEISLWAGSSGYTMDSANLWEYYSSKEELAIDEESSIVLTHASVENEIYGLTWLSYIDLSSMKDFLPNIPTTTQEEIRVAEIFAVIGETDGLRNYYESLFTDTDFGRFPDLLETSELDNMSRFEQLIESDTHSLQVNDVNLDFTISELDLNEIQDTIGEVAAGLEYIEPRISGFDSWYQRKRSFREALGDLELAIGAFEMAE